MKRTLKMLFLLLFVSTVSFVYAQDEIDGADKGGKSLVKDNAKKALIKQVIPEVRAMPKNQLRSVWLAMKLVKQEKKKNSEKEKKEAFSAAYLVVKK